MPFSPGRGPAIPSDATKCVCTGEALTKAMTRQWSTFNIEAFTADGVRQTAGGEVFVVSVRGASVVSSNVIDNQDGTYAVRYRAAVSGKYELSIALHGYQLAGGPFGVSVLSRAPDPRACKLKGAGLSKAVAREPTAFEVEFIDSFGQVTHAEELDLYVEWVGDTIPPAPEVTADEADVGKKGRGDRASRASYEPVEAPAVEASIAAAPAVAEAEPTGATDGAAASPTAEASEAAGAKAVPVSEEAQPADAGYSSADEASKDDVGSKECRNGRSQSARGSLQRSSRSTSPRSPRRFRLDASERQQVRSPLLSVHTHCSRPALRLYPLLSPCSPVLSPELRCSPLTSADLLPSVPCQHMTLWTRRLATEGVSKAKPPSIALTQRNTARPMSPGRRGQHDNPQGPSYAHELDADAKGVAFAFGGVDPGTLHAAGKVRAEWRHLELSGHLVALSGAIWRRSGAAAGCHSSHSSLSARLSRRLPSPSSTSSCSPPPPSLPPCARSSRRP